MNNIHEKKRSDIATLALLYYNNARVAISDLEKEKARVSSETTEAKQCSYFYY